MADTEMTAASSSSDVALPPSSALDLSACEGPPAAQSRKDRKKLLKALRNPVAAAMNIQGSPDDPSNLKENLDMMEWCRKYITPKVAHGATSSSAAAPASQSACSADSVPPHPSALPRVVILLGYDGTGYSGSQIQRSYHRSIEGELLKSLVTLGVIDLRDPRVTLQALNWQRTARTDLGVHACCNLVSTRVHRWPTDLKQQLNASLPKEIRVFEIMPICPVLKDEVYSGWKTGSSSVNSTASISVATANGNSSDPISQQEPGDNVEFHCKNSCTGRIYEYLMPSAIWGLWKPNQQDIDEALERVASIQQNTAAADPSAVPGNGRVAPPFARLLHPRDMTALIHALRDASTALETSKQFILAPLESTVAPPTAVLQSRIAHLQHFRHHVLPKFFVKFNILREHLHYFGKGTNQAPFVLPANTVKRTENTAQALAIKVDEELQAEQNHMNTTCSATSSHVQQLEAFSHFSPAALQMADFMRPHYVASPPSTYGPDGAPLSTPSASAAVLPYSHFVGARLVPADVEIINGVLGRYCDSTPKDYHNFTKIDPRVTQKAHKQCKIRSYGRNNTGSATAITVASASSRADSMEDSPALQASASPEQPGNESDGEDEREDADEPEEHEVVGTANGATAAQFPQHVIDDYLNSYSRRLVHTCRVSELVMINGVEYTRVVIGGRSFVLNQIRKMVGFAVVTVHAITGNTTVLLNPDTPPSPCPDAPSAAQTAATPIDDAGAASSSASAAVSAPGPRIYLNATWGSMGVDELWTRIFEPNFHYDLPTAPARGLLLCGFEFQRYERLCAAYKWLQQHALRPVDMKPNPENDATVCAPVPPEHDYSIDHALARNQALIKELKHGVIEPIISQLTQGHVQYRHFLFSLRPDATTQSKRQKLGHN